MPYFDSPCSNVRQPDRLNLFIRRGLGNGIRLASTLLDPWIGQTTEPRTLHQRGRGSSWGMKGRDTRERAGRRRRDGPKNLPRPSATTAPKMPIGSLCSSDSDWRLFSFLLMARLPGNGKSFSSSLKPKKPERRTQERNASDAGVSPAGSAHLPVVLFSEGAAVGQIDPQNPVSDFTTAHTRRDISSSAKMISPS